MWVLETTPRNSARIARVPLENNIVNYLIHTTRLNIQFSSSVSLQIYPISLPIQFFLPFLPLSLIFPVSQLSPVGVSQLLLWGQPSSEVTLTGPHL